MSDIRLEDISSLMRRRGFVFPSSEIYGGWEAAYDFGPLGAELLRNLRNAWWEYFVHNQPNITGIDSAIISHPKVWEASGHLASFSDVMVEDIKTNKRYRADHLIEDALGISADGLSEQEVDELIKQNNLTSPDGNPLSSAKKFQLLVEASVGTLNDAKSVAYLRGETCQPIFYSYKLVKETARMKLPFGIAQIGKAFRNEIKVGPFIFRTREFEQMELEMFCSPENVDEWYAKLKSLSMEWLQSIGIDEAKLRYRDQEFKERAHYNKIATDLEYQFPFGWKEFQGIHNRGDWDLSRHGEFSGENFSEVDENGKEFIPHVAEYSIGLNRLMLVVMCDAFRQDENRTWLALNPRIAPIKAAIFPLLRNKPELVEMAHKIYSGMCTNVNGNIAWDDRGNIGKRYLSQDEVGTPFCITVDFTTLEDHTVTVRDRDTMEQKRVAVDELSDYINNKLLARL